MKALRRLMFACCSAVFASVLMAADLPVPQSAAAIFAGGCFWCLEADFEKLDGVIAVESGYTGGHVNNPTYQQVSQGGTGHAEAVRVHYDLQRVSYEKLLDYFWRHIDPTVKDRQFCDVGSQYRSAIFYQNESEQKLALSSKQVLEKSGRFPHIYTEIVAATAFYPAEDYHQDYHRKNPIRYLFYRVNCGRDARVKALWGDAQLHRTGQMITVPMKSGFQPRKNTRNCLFLYTVAFAILISKIQHKPAAVFHLNL